MTATGHAYRSDIDGLRAVAVGAVVLFHIGIANFSGGFAGVDVFFVISGYLITSIIIEDMRTGSFSIGRFYERRIRRIFPALFVVLAASCVAASILLLPQDFKSFGDSLAAATLFVSNVFFWKTTDYFSGPVHLKPLLHTWSLAVEEQFYVAFPLLLVAIQRWGRGAFRIWLALFLRCFLRDQHLECNGKTPRGLLSRTFSRLGAPARGRSGLRRA
jgi:Predicted acyltransferases